MYLITDCISGKTAKPVGVLILSCIVKFDPGHFTCLPRGEMGETSHRQKSLLRERHRSALANCVFRTLAMEALFIFDGAMGGCVPR